MLVTHESFNLPKRIVKAFEAESGIDLVTRAAGDAGTLTAKLSLTKDNPTGDVAFGVDNTFASRPLDGGPIGADDATWTIEQPVHARLHRASRAPVPEEMGMKASRFGQVAVLSRRRHSARAAYLEGSSHDSTGSRMNAR